MNLLFITSTKPALQIFFYSAVYPSRHHLVERNLLAGEGSAGVEESISSNNSGHGFAPPLSCHPVQCGICGAVLRQARNLRRHHQVYHQIVKFPCDYCDCVYNREDTLSKHLRFKHGITEKIACQHCDKAFWSKLSLTEHEKKVHSIAN